MFSRPGGRIQSCWYGDIVAELGANWKPDNPLSHPIYRLSATEEPPRPGVAASEYPRGILNSALPGNIDYPMSIVAYHKFRQIEHEAAEIYCLGGNKQQGSIINYMSIRIQQELQDFPEEQRYDAARILFGLVHMLSAKCGSDISLLCADNMGCYMNIPGGEVRVPLGLIGILAPMLCQIPEGTIQYCKRVECIYWGSTKQQKSGHRVIINTTDGCEFTADYVIITVSLGVLQQNSVKMFCPALPASKMDAVRSLGYGYCNKVFTEYDTPFWVWHKGSLNFKFCCNELCNHYDWTSGITEITPIPTSKHILGIYLVGPGAMMMEAQGDRDVVEGITNLLRCCTGNPCLPYPKTILRSHWASNPLFCGAYSYDCCGSNGDAQRALACPLPGPSEPIPPMLLFAGEATVPGHYATIGGARLSGIREAERIVQLTLKYKGPPDVNLDDHDADKKEPKKAKAR